MNISIETKDLHLLNTGWVQIDAGGEMYLKVEQITLMFIHVIPKESENKVATIRNELDEKNLISKQIIEGNVPIKPLSISTIRPMLFGTVGGIPVLMSASICYTGQDRTTLDVVYSIYKEKKNTQKSILSTKEKKNGGM